MILEILRFGQKLGMDLFSPELTLVCAGLERAYLGIQSKKMVR